jgi:1-aminocyclopropane-1-carboxylate deaminase/D-cysteine desulfhydrase-like pyridoxal-dependent ACC family enzyme
VNRRYLLAYILALNTATAAAQTVKFISGGVGADSVQQMAAVGKEFNLKLLFAAKDGHYLGDVAISISAGRRKLLDDFGRSVFVRAIAGRQLRHHGDLCRIGSDPKHRGRRCRAP